MHGEKNRGWGGEIEEKYLTSVSEERQEKSHQSGRGHAAGRGRGEEQGLGNTYPETRELIFTAKLKCE